MSASDWTFLSNHGHVLVFLSQNPDARITDIAQTVGITERATQSIIADLERDGYIKISKVGRRNRYKINAKARFRHPAESHQSVAALLGIFAD